ncbi:MAG: PilZ domain-containing protein [Desulfobacterium sp.]
MGGKKYSGPGKERRRHERVAVKQGSYAAISPNSFKIGQIKNISRGGLLFSYIDTENPPIDQVENHLFLSSSNAYVSKLPFKTISDRPVDRCEENNTPSMRERGIEFGALTLIQMMIIDNYIVANSR